MIGDKWWHCFPVLLIYRRNAHKWSYVDKSGYLLQIAVSQIYMIVPWARELFASIARRYAWTPFQATIRADVGLQNERLYKYVPFISKNKRLTQRDSIHKPFSRCRRKREIRRSFSCQLDQRVRLLRLACISIIYRGDDRTRSRVRMLVQLRRVLKNPQQKSTYLVLLKMMKSWNCRLRSN